jgi:hypothetical protein
MNTTVYQADVFQTEGESRNYPFLIPILAENRRRAELPHPLSIENLIVTGIISFSSQIPMLFYQGKPNSSFVLGADLIADSGMATLQEGSCSLFVKVRQANAVKIKVRTMRNI